PYGRQVGGERGGELDVLADQPPQHGLQVGDDRIELEQLGREHLAATVREQLAGEVGGTRGRLANLLEVVAHGVLGGNVPHQQLRGAENRREDVVEVVRDPAGEL